MNFGQLLLLLLQGGLVTLQIAIGAWVVSVVLELVIALSRDKGGPFVGVPITVLVAFLRSVPQLVVLYLFYFGLGAIGIQIPSLLAAILAIGITEASFTAEYFRAGFMTVPDTQRDAGMSIGLSSLGVMRRVVIPQTIPYLVPPLLNSFVGLLKTATLASAVGAPEILYQGQLVMTQTGEIAQIAALVIALYLLVTLPLTRTVRRLESRVRHGAYA